MTVKEATVFEDKLEEIQVQPCQPCLVTASMCSRSSRVEVPTEMQIDEDAGRLNFSPPPLERLENWCRRLAKVFEDKLELEEMEFQEGRVEVPTEMQIDEDAGRFYFSPAQIERLDREYMMDKNPSIEWRNELAKEFQVPANKIHYWYSKSRQKDGHSEKAFKYVNDIATKINLPKNITDMANGLFKAVYEGKRLRCRSKALIAAACVFLACRQGQVPKSLRVIASVCDVKLKQIGKMYRLILKCHDTNVTNVYLIAIGDFMSRFCGTLSLGRNIQMAATCIAKRAVDMDIVRGRSPISVAAAAMYMASQASSDKRTQKEIADIAGVADVTIRQSYKLLLTRARDLFPEGFKFVTPIENLPVC